MKKKMNFLNAMFTYEMSYNHADLARRYTTIQELQDHLMSNDAYSKHAKRRVISPK
jgi:hypothetical protein